MTNLNDAPQPDFVDRNDALRFASRTRMNLLSIEEMARSGHDVHPVTQLINSMLGMFIFVRERYFLSQIENVSLETLSSQGWPTWNSTIDQPKTLRQLLRHLRNATAHGGLFFNSDSSDPSRVDVEFTDRDPKTGQLTWQGNIRADRLRDFILRLVADLENRIG